MATAGLWRPPQGLEWGEVLISVRAAPINPADLYNAAMGSASSADGGEKLAPPFLAGNDCLGVVMKARI